MKIHINKQVARFFSAALLASSLTACDDFLSIIPLNDVVLENYWTEEADVTSVVNSCYSQLLADDCLKRMLIWGELRSDNLATGGNNNIEIARIAEENILETNGLVKWDAFYQCINRCNTVLYYAPSVNEKDPNYTDAELRANIAEVTAIRALCYFYLIRTFRNVPYVTEPSIDDGQNYRVPASSFDEILTNLINDLEAVKNDAVRTYGEDNPKNKTHITRYAIYALLADMYLWQGNYQKCIEYCDQIIDYKIAEYEEDLQETSALDVELYGRFPLISVAPANSTRGGTVFTEIFGTGLSFESIFELNIVDSETRENGLVRDLFGKSDGSSVGQVAPLSYLKQGLSENTNNYFQRSDTRAYENMEGDETSGVTVAKYFKKSVDYLASSSTALGYSPTFTNRSDDHSANWIVYRLTDVMLMKAEAEVMLAGDVVDGTALTPEQDARFKAAWECVIAVWKRANNKRTASDTLVYTDYATSRLAMENLVMDERQRELMFEGKRWFDLVRICRRDGSNQRMLDKVMGKFKENIVAIRIRLASPDALYLPYHEDELRANPYLVQNPAYENESITQTE